MRKQKFNAMKRRVRAVFGPNELILIRHGVTQTSDRLCGRTDVGLSETQPDILSAVVSVLAPIEQVITSPAQRCTQTADLIWGQGVWPKDGRMWEQDFGDWENRLYQDIPDIGELNQQALAAHAPPQGESFLDLCARFSPALQEAANRAQADGPVAIVAHGGVIRAALGHALKEPAKGLGFEVAHLSITRLRCLPEGRFSVIATNWHPA